MRATWIMPIQAAGEDGARTLIMARRLGIVPFYCFVQTSRRDDTGSGGANFVTDAYRCDKDGLIPGVIRAFNNLDSSEAMRLTEKASLFHGENSTEEQAAESHLEVVSQLAGATPAEVALWLSGSKSG